jgi:hypothetical protein
VAQFIFDVSLGNINFDHFRSGSRQIDLTEAIALTHNGKRAKLGVEVIELQCGDLTGAGAGFDQQLDDDIVAKALRFMDVHRI